MQSGLFIIILVVQSERLMCVPIDPFLISGAPRRCIRRTTGDWGGGGGAPSLGNRWGGGGKGGGGAVISLGYRCGWCGNKRGIYSSLFWLLWKTLARG